MLKQGIFGRVKYLNQNLKTGLPATFREASKELTPGALDAWVRMILIIDPEDLFGVSRVQKAIGFKQDRTWKAMNELRQKGYLAWDPTPGKSSQAALIRKAKLTGKNSFEDLSKALLKNFPELTDPDDMKDAALRGCHFYSLFLSKVFIRVIRNEIQGTEKCDVRDAKRVIKSFSKFKTKNCSHCFILPRCSRSFSEAQELIKKCREVSREMFIQPLFSKFRDTILDFPGESSLTRGKNGSIFPGTNNLEINPKTPQEILPHFQYAKNSIKIPGKLSLKIFKISLKSLRINDLNLVHLVEVLDFAAAAPEASPDASSSLPEIDQNKSPAVINPIASRKLSPPTPEGNLMPELAERKIRGFSKEKFEQAWKAQKELRKEVREECRSLLEESAVKTVKEFTGRVCDPKTALEILRTDGEVIYKTLMAKHPQENLLFKPDEEEVNAFRPVYFGRKNNPDRTIALKALGEAMVRVYTTFRSQYQSFACIDGDSETVREGAGFCYNYQISPAQLIALWVEKAPKFTKMEQPSLRFICNLSNVEEAKCCLPLPWEPEYQERNFKPREKPKRTPVPKGGAEVTRDMMSAFGKEDELDPRIRPGLTAAGIDVSQYNDKFLATYQATGKAYANRPGFVSSASAPIVKWIARNIYGLRD